MISIFSVLSFLLVCASAGNFFAYFDPTVNASWGLNRPNKYYSETAIKLGIDVVFIYSLSLSDTNKTAWGGNDSMPFEWVKPFTDELKAGNVKIGVTFGGLDRTDISFVMKKNELVKNYQKAIDDLSADYLNFEFEVDRFNGLVALSAIKEIQTKNPKLITSMVLPVSPNGIIEEVISKMRIAKMFGYDFHRLHIRVKNCSLLSYTDLENCTKVAIGSTKKQLATIYTSFSDAQLYARIVPVVTIGQNINESAFTLKQLHTFTSFANQSGFDISMWSLTRDRPGPVGVFSDDHSGYADQTYPFQFSEEFIKDIKSGNTTTTSVEATTTINLSTTTSKQMLTSVQTTTVPSSMGPLTLLSLPSTIFFLFLCIFFFLNF